MKISAMAKIRVVGWTLIIFGLLTLLIPPYEWRSMAGILWIIAGVCILKRSNIARVTVKIFSLIAICFVPIGLLASLLPIWLKDGKTIPSELIFQLLFVSGVNLGFFVFVFLMLKSKEMKLEFTKNNKNKTVVELKEPKKIDIKKTIAREGLVIVGIAATGGLIILLSTVLPDAVSFKENLSIIGFAILIYSWNIIYLVYLLVRFVLWAMRTVKEK